ncbi:MAG: hypothetical protein AAFN10_02625, partial [Bacteroidota bacterium]
VRELYLFYVAALIALVSPLFKATACTHLLQRVVHFGISGLKYLIFNNLSYHPENAPKQGAGGLSGIFGKDREAVEIPDKRFPRRSKQFPG